MPCRGAGPPRTDSALSSRMCGRSWRTPPLLPELEGEARQQRRIERPGEEQVDSPRGRTPTASGGRASSLWMLLARSRSVHRGAFVVAKRAAPSCRTGERRRTRNPLYGTPARSTSSAAHWAWAGPRHHRLRRGPRSPRPLSVLMGAARDWPARLLNFLLQLHTESRLHRGRRRSWRTRRRSSHGEPAQVRGDLSGVGEWDLFWSDGGGPLTNLHRAIS